MAFDPTTSIAAAIAAVARFVPSALFGLLVAAVVMAIWGDRFRNPEVVGVAFFAGGALLWYLGEEGWKKCKAYRAKKAKDRATAEEKASAERAAAEEREAGDVAEKARLAGAFNRLPTDAQELLLSTRLADHTRLEVDARGTIHTALLSCPLVQPIGPRKGSVQGYPWGDYFQYDLLDVGIERVDALLAKLKEEEPTTYAELETRAKRRR